MRDDDSSACPSDDDLAAYIDGRLTQPGQAAIRHHLVACDVCADLVAEYAEAWSMSPGPAFSATENTNPGNGPRPLPPTLDRYTVRSRLGVGGMGEVLSAQDPLLDRPVAIKRLFTSDRASLLREASFVARLDHPNVVQIYDVTDGGDEALIVMELVDGDSLDRWLRHPRDPDEVLDVFRQAAQGLASAHAAGVVHRDFKPHNVLIGRDGRVRISDFGLARFTGDQRPGSGGTQIYAAPEQSDGSEAKTASDQYSFCCAMLEAVVGRRPDPRETWADLLAEIPDTWSRPRRQRLVVALKQGLSPRIEGRWPSMDALLGALPGLTRSRARRWTRLAALGTAAAVAVAVAVGIAMKSELPAGVRAGLAPASVPDTIATDALSQGRAFSQREDFVAARTQLELAWRAATLAGNDAVAADAALSLAVAAVNAQEREVAALAVRDAAASVARLTDDPSRRGRLLSVQAGVLLLEGHSDEAVQRAREAEAVLEAAPADDPHRSAATQILASALLRANRFEEAVVVSQRALAAHGGSRNDPSQMPTMAALALALLGVDENEPAVELARQRAQIAKSHFGPDALGTLRARAFLGGVLSDAGHDIEARDELSAAIEKLAQQLDPNNPYLAHLRVQLAEIQRQQGDFDDAVRNLHAAVEAQRASLPADHPNLEWSKRKLAETQLARAEALGRNPVGKAGD